jgi:Fe2+ or Zn2+ uptake regulation protein
MSPDDQLSTELAARGLRATRQRIGVLRVLRRATAHPTAAEVHRTILKQQPNVSLKTVYDILESLVAAGLACCVHEGGGPARFEADKPQHYHARCRVCGRLYDLPSHSDGHIRARTPIPEGFEVERIAVTILGRCPRCRDDF